MSRAILHLSVSLLALESVNGLVPEDIVGTIYLLIVLSFI